MGPAPAVAAIRHAVRGLLAEVIMPTSPGGMPAGGHQVLVACSGGADSLALAAATAFVAPRLGLRAGLVTVDHRLQDGSADRARRVAGFGADLGLDPVVSVAVDVGTDGGPEAAARAARYRALDAAAAPRDAHVLLAHTADDQAESVLLGLGRGSGPRSVVGMAAVTGRYLRPLLGLRRADTAAACAALRLEPWDDPHNHDPRFTRARLRSEVLPLLEDVLHGGVVEALARTADLLRADLAALDDWAAAVDLPPAGAGLPVADLLALPAAVRTRVLRRWAVAAGAGSLTAERTAALDALVTSWHGQRAVRLPGGVSVRRASGRLETNPTREPSRAERPTAAEEQRV